MSRGTTLVQPPVARTALKASNKAGDEVTLKIYRDSDEDDSSKTFEITFKLDAA